jgi:hypothetical protein
VAFQIPGAPSAMISAGGRIALEYGAKPRGGEPAPAAPAEMREGAAEDGDDIPF